MKQFFFAFLLLAVSSGLPIFLAAAAATPAPEVDEAKSPIDADIITLTGTAEPDSRVSATGGKYEVAPVTADEDGHFEITVALVQESTNVFYVQAVLNGMTSSASVNVSIVEGEEAAKAHEASTGEDHTAPKAPEIEETNIETNEETFTIAGTGEANAKILVNDAVTGEEVQTDGDLELEVDLTGEGATDVFTISLMDKAGNVSSGVKVSITSEGVSNRKEPLTDIEDHWAEDYINTLYEDDIISGYGDGTFGPDDRLTRSQIVKIAMLAFEYETGKDYETNPFSDVYGGDWFYDYVLEAENEGVVSGYEDGSFKPNNEVTRAEALKIILTAGGITEYDSVVPNFNDVNTIEDWFAKYTAYAKDSGLVSGYSDGSFRGNQGITRAEVCKIVVELMESLE